jgi:hypothetical protein
MVDDFPAELEQFIALHIESLAHLEALLLMRNESERQWDAAEFSRRLYITPDMGAGIVAELERHGFVERSGENPEYFRYRRDPQMDRQVGDLAALYQQRRVAVITKIFSKPVKKVQTFADAFRLRREE